MGSRQTTSFLMRRFESAGIRPDHRRGQNFLTDLNLLALLADSAEIDRQDLVLEIGTGLGSLTALLARRAAGVVTVEVDQRLHQLAAEQLLEQTNVTLLLHDALRNKNNLDARIMDEVRAAMERHGATRFKLVANLPYNIATPVVSNLLSVTPIPASMTVTIQKELADRMVASPGSKDYSALSIWLQCQCRTSIIRIMPPSVFWPRPKVHSAIVQIVPVPEMRAEVGDLPFFHGFVRSVFIHRRKFLRASLVSAYGREMSKQDVDTLLEDQGLKHQIRAEELEVAALLKLSRAVQQRLAAK
jgi:16S rRNA (adenine1518-N6/adenine1519-N6)-dimethyltransferase